MARTNAITLWIPKESFWALFQWDRFLNHGGCLALPRLDAGEMEDGTRLAIPHDAEIDDVCYEPLRRAFGLMLSHNSFPSTPDGLVRPSVVLREATVRALQGEQQKEDGPIIVNMETPP